MTEVRYDTSQVNNKPYRRLGYRIANLQGVGQRARQEDSFTLVNAFDVKTIKREGLLFAVCDGMGGMKDGKEASEKAVTVIRQCFAALNRQGDISSQLKETLHRASDKVEDLVGGAGGSTAILSVIYDDKLYYASVGDSYYYLKRGDCVYRINREHNVCNRICMELLRDGIMDPTEGREDSETAALTQFIGMRGGIEDIDAFVRPLPLIEGDVLLACSDGVGGTIDENEILAALSLDNPNDMCTAMEQGILRHGKVNQDNYTAIVVQCVM